MPNAKAGDEAADAMPAEGMEAPLIGVGVGDDGIDEEGLPVDTRGGGSTSNPGASRPDDDNDDDDEEANEEIQDYRGFAALVGGGGGKAPIAKGGSRRQQISSQTIRKGEKDFEEHGTRAQRDALEQSRAVMESVLAHTRDMAVRLKSAIQLMQKWVQANTAAADIKAEAVQTALADHEAFLSWYLAFLRAELAPTASYQRHFTALKATAWLLRQRRDVAGAVSGSDNAANAAAADPTLDHDLARRLFRDTAWVRCVLDRIMDPFDDVRETAAALLALAPGGDVSLAATLTAFTARADARASLTARQDHADGAARCHGLLCAWAAPSHHDQRAVLLRVLDVLERKIATADADLAAAAVTAPVHGEFAAIRYIWGVLVKERYEDDADIACLHAAQARIVACCDRIWRIVQHVLCDDSPEGHLLEGDQASATTLLDSKDLLSYSFRAINEASNTMRAIVAPLRFSRVQGMLLPDRAVFAAIGHLSFAQLAALRHRGALTTVAQTFTLCCQLARDPLVTTTPPLVTTWYEGTLDCIRSQGSTTRRSAGIPSLFAGILASNAAAPTFDDAMRTVCDIAQQPPPANSTTADNPHLPQVHAFNCLRDVFRSSLLSKRAERLLPACLQLAAASLRADVWAIRNCGLLLLRSLIDCLFGTGESKASLESGWDGRTIRVSFNKYPSLPGVLLGLLDADDGQTATQQAAAESVFPALDIIRRAGAPPDTDTNHPHRPALYRAVVHYLGSTLWHVREMAARTLCSFLIVQDDWPAALQALFLPEDASTNRLHGSLLAVRFAVARIAELHPADDVAPHLPRLAAWLDALARANNGFSLAACPDVRAAYLEARNTICHLAIDFGLPLADFVLPDDECADHVSPPQSALLVAQSVLHTNYAAAARNDRAALETLLSRVAVTDPDTATRLLDAVPHAWSAANDNSTTTTTAWLATVYLRVAHESRAAPLVRAAALRHLADALDCLLRPAQQPSLLPSADALVRLWTSLARADTINPTLSWAILRVSGPIMAALQSPPNTTPLSIPAWAAMLKAAGSDDQTYDTRLAAADALRSFALAGTLTTLTTLPPADLLPVVACIYDSLNDDDDEIRDVAADAAAAVLGKPLIPGEAARQLPMWMAAHLGPQHEHMPDFAAQAAARMLGHTTSLPPSSWPSAADLLNDALHFDDALFLVEEQNLFIDEVREAERWGHVVQHLYPTHNQHGLAAWIADGLDALVRRLNDNTATDGPLGWTAAPSVFAVCARLLVGATSILRSGATQGPEERRLQALLDDFCQAGEAAQIHGLLLAMAKV